ncbi:MAG TPA: hypothetical protein EYP54_10085 [Anaerolineales bacterium]|nr:hypothetical protein [Anaerolineales bacterium]
MKTIFIPLEPHDDILSVLDRLNWVKGHRALLLWPEEGCGLETRLDFVRLVRRARALNLRLALVTTDRRIASLAQAVGLPTFASREEALRRPWARRRRRRRLRRPPPRDLYALREALRRLAPSWQRHPLVRLAAFTLGAFAVLALAAFTLPGATVTLSPEPDWQEVTLTVRASPDDREVHLDGRVPARWVEVTVDGTDEMVPHGRAQVPYRAATAVLRFVNLTTKEVQVPAGTMVFSRASLEIRFAVIRGGVVPPSGTLTLTAQALQPGAQGNRPADDLQGLEAPLAFQLRVTNPYPATGGQDVTVPAPTEADQAILRRRLEIQLAQQALQRLQEESSAGVLLAPSFHRAATLEEAFSAEVGEPAQVLRLSLRQVYGVLVVEQDTLKALARQVLDARLQGDLWPLNDTLEVQPLSQPRQVAPEKPVFRWRLRVRRMVLPRVDGEALARDLSGRPPGVAAARLAARFAQTHPPQITLFPSWWPRLPWLAFRIQIAVQRPTPSSPNP